LKLGQQFLSVSSGNLVMLDSLNILEINYNSLLNDDNLAINKNILKVENVGIYKIINSTFKSIQILPVSINNYPIYIDESELIIYSSTFLEIQAAGLIYYN
jgi:hypothetical protein